MRRCVVVTVVMAVAVSVSGQQRKNGRGVAPPSSSEDSVHAVTGQVAAPPGPVNSAMSPPPHPVTATQVRELMNVTGMAKLEKEAVDQIMPTVRASMPPYMPVDVLQDIETSLFGPDMEAAIVRAYQAHLSTEDAAAAIAFYSSPAGHHMVTATPEIVHDLQVQSGEIVQKVMSEILKRHQAEIDAAKLKYEEAHPWSPPKN